MEELFSHFTGSLCFPKKTKGELLDTNPHAPLKSNYLQLFVKGFLLNFINVGVLVFWLGIIIVVGPNLDANPSRFLLFFGTLIISYFLTDVVKILLAKRLKAYLTPLIILNIKKALGVLLLICGITLITKGFLPKDKLNPTQIIEDIR